MIKDIIKRLIRIYTPFICAVVAIIHGVLYLIGVTGCVYAVLGNFTGHSILLLLYVLSTCKQMCVWYKRTVKLLIATHIVNILYYLGLFDINGVMYYSLVFNIFALLSFLLYRIKVGITKFLC